MRKQLTLIGIALLAASAPANAQVLIRRVDQDAIPASMVVQRGTRIEFDGKLDPSDGAPAATIFVRTNNSVRTSGTFIKQYALVWDPSHELQDRITATLTKQEGNGPEVRIGRVSVTVVDRAPFRITSPADNATADGPVRVKVSNTGNLPFTGGEILIDGADSGMTLDSNGTVTANLLAFRPGLHSLSVRVATGDTGDFETEPLHIRVQTTISLTRNGSGPLDLRFDAPGQIPVHLVTPGQGLPIKSVDYMLDGKPFSHTDAAPFVDSAFDPSGLATGPHSLSAAVILADGQRLVTPDLPLDVIGSATAAVAGWQNQILKPRREGHVAARTVPKRRGCVR